MIYLYLFQSIGEPDLVNVLTNKLNEHLSNVILLLLIIMAQFNSLLEMLSEFRGEEGSIGQDLVNKGEYQAAINFFDEALNAYPKSVYFMYGKGVALAGLGKYDEAIEYYDKIIETSEKYLLDTLQSIATFIDLYRITYSAFYEKWDSLSKLSKFVEASICLDKTKEYLEAWPPEGKTFRTWENFWLYRAKTFLKKQDDVGRCLSNLKQAFVIYK